MIKIYTAQAMTGEIKSDVVAKDIRDREFLEKAGFKVLSPVFEENVKPTSSIQVQTKEEMDYFWFRDKQMIREAHVLFDMSPHKNSEGCKHELGYGRYFLFKPVVRVFPEGKLPLSSSVAYFEDDIVVDSLLEAVEWVCRVYGTPLKRLKWKLNLFNRCFINYLYIRFMWLVDWY